MNKLAELPYGAQDVLKDWMGASNDWTVVHFWHIDFTYHIVTCDWTGSIGCFRVWEDYFSKKYQLSKDASYNYGSDLDSDEE